MYFWPMGPMDPSERYPQWESYSLIGITYGLWGSHVKKFPMRGAIPCGFSPWGPSPMWDHRSIIHPLLLLLNFGDLSTIRLSEPVAKPMANNCAKSESKEASWGLISTHGDVYVTPRHLSPKMLCMVQKWVYCRFESFLRLSKPCSMLRNRYDVSESKQEFPGGTVVCYTTMRWRMDVRLVQQL